MAGQAWLPARAGARADRAHRRHGTQNILVRFRKSVLDKELRVNERHVGELVASMIPALLAEPGVGAISAAHLIIA